MSKRFPHLSDTSFPDIGTVHPYQRKTDFDYARYDYEATIKLCNVTWPYDYSHVVNWKSEEQRDAYFAGVDGRSVEMGQGFVRTQLDSVSVPVPYDVALTYNYVYARIPMLTDDEAIDYEVPAGIRTVCAFVSDVVYQAPSTTLLVLDVDWWTTYLPHLSITSMMLTRGHAPMWDVSADEYLADPRRKCGRLLTPDVDFGHGAEMVRAGEVMPLSTAEPMLVMASTIPYASIASIPTVSTGSSTPPTYYDTGARNGEQVGVNGFTWSPGGKSYTGMSSPSDATHIDNEMTTGLWYYGMPGSDVASGALDMLFSSLPVFAASVQAAYLVPSDLVTLGTTITVAGVELTRIYSKGAFQDLGTFEILKSAFGYPAKYADIAKLYTFPYSHVTVSDDAGASIDVRIETTDGTIEAAQMVSIAWPMLAWDVALTNVASTGGRAAYTWMRLQGDTYERHVPNADVAAHLMSYDFPTYALYLDASTEQGMVAQAGTERSRHDAIVAYQSTMRSANTAEQNAYASNATAKANADASADTNVTNTANTGRTQSSNTDVQNTARSAETTARNTANSTIEGIVNQQTFNLGEQDDEFTTYSGDAQLKGEAVGGVMNTVNAAMTGDIGGTIAAGVGSVVAISTKSAITDAASHVITTKVGINQDANSDTSAAQRQAANDITSAQNNAATQITSNNVGNANTNAQNSAETAKNNAKRSKETGDDNAGYTRDTTEENAKAQLENTQQDYMDDLRRYDVMPPNAHGGYSGTGIHEQMRNRGLHFRIVTQDDSSIARAGDAFLRYGYRYDGMWDMSGWCPKGARYCYWQSSDIQQDMTARPNPMAARAIRAILEQGITVWADPKEIGRW